MVLEMVRVACGGFAQRVLGARGQRDDVPAALPTVAGFRRRRGLADDGVRIGPTGAEAAHPAHARTILPRPGPERVGNLDIHAAPVDVRVGPSQVLWWDYLAVLHAEVHFEQPRN